jgi:transcription elongation factor GreA
MEALDLREKIAEASGASFQESSPEPFGSLDRLLDAVEETRQLQGLADIAGEALTVQKVDPARAYLNGFALVRLGRPDDAVKILISLCGKLEQEARWPILAVLIPRVLESAPSVEAARSLAKVGETIGVDKIDAEALERAYDLYPDEERLAYLMGERAAADGRTEEAVGFWAESLDGFVGLKRYDRIEEIILKVADSARPEHQRHVLNLLHRLADQNQWHRFFSFLELALPGIRNSGLIGDLWKLVLHLFPKAPEDSGLRKWIRTLAPEAFPAADGILDLLGRSGILDPQVRAEVSIKQLETLLEFAPGFRVLHASWGIGKVALNDGDTLVVDFKETKNHRMKLTLARRALTVMAPEDLRVLQAESPDELKRMIKEEPAEVIARTLRLLRGEATTQDLRRTLTSQGVIATQGWTSWWKDARAALEKDDRIDLSQSFRQVYRLRAEGDDGDEQMQLPSIEPRRGIRPNLNLIRRFLEQHPDETARAARMYTAILERWARDEKTSAEDCLAVHLQLYRWRREVREDFSRAVSRAAEAGVEMSAYSDPEDQKLIAEAAVTSDASWKDGCLFVLSARSAEIREVARERMRGDPAGAQSFLNELLRDPTARPLATLAVIDLVLDETQEPFTPEPWLAALAATLLIDGANKEPLRKQALSILRPHGPLAERLRGCETPYGNAERWTVVLRRWRASERYLQPVLEFLRAAGHAELVQEVVSAHAERTDKALGGAASASAVDYRGHLMARATIQKLVHERNQLVWDLKNVVSKAIQRAREFGDLSENAEYDAAKMKQADHARRIAEISRRLAEAKAIENLAIPDDEVAPGTEIHVEDVVTRDKRVLWLLGEGDDWLGPEVISYVAPLGRSLIGKRVGERVSVVGSDSVHELLIRGIAKRLPQVAEETTPADLEVTDQDVREVVEGIGEAGVGPTA